MSLIFDIEILRLKEYVLAPVKALIASPIGRNTLRDKSVDTETAAQNMKAITPIHRQTS